MGKFVDLTGRRFGRLLVQYRADDYISPSGKRTIVWHCLCDCGKEVDILRSSLSNGTKSCGCLQREAAEAAADDLTGQRFGRLLVIRRVDGVKSYSNGLKHAWLCRCDCGTERIYTQKDLIHSGRKSCGCLLKETSKMKVSPDGSNIFGHIDGTALSAISLDRGANKNSKSGVRGVYYSPAERKYVAKIGFRGKTITLGRFDKIEDAEKVRKQAEEKYFIPVLEKYKN